MSDYESLEYMSHTVLANVHYVNPKGRDLVILLECTISGTTVIYAFDSRVKMELFLKETRNSCIDKGMEFDYSITEKTIEGGKISH